LIFIKFRRIENKDEENKEENKDEENNSSSKDNKLYRKVL
jgi:hypothetical protein